MYTPFLNRIELTAWTICAFRVLNPRQWSWAKQVESNYQNVPNQAEAKRDGVINPKKLQFQSILNTENFDALQTLRIKRSRPLNLDTCKN